MQNRIDERCLIEKATVSAELTKEQMNKLICEQQTLIAEMKQEQTCAEIAYANIYRKYTQIIYEKSLLQNEAQEVREAKRVKEIKEAEAEEAKRVLNEILHSRSWRITAPLRAAGRMLKRWIK